MIPILLVNAFAFWYSMTLFIIVYFHLKKLSQHRGPSNNFPLSHGNPSGYFKTKINVDKEKSYYTRKQMR